MPTLQQGSSGPAVTSLQQILKDLGFDPNGVDGRFGTGTRDAVIAFQQSKGLQANGVAGPDTMAALQLAGGAANTNTGTPAAPTPAPPANPGSASALNWPALPVTFRLRSSRRFRKPPQSSG